MRLSGAAWKDTHLHAGDSTVQAPGRGNAVMFRVQFRPYRVKPVLKPGRRSTEEERMKSYPKIETLFERDERTHKVIPERLRNPVVADISKWIVTEKIDGTNIRVSFTKGETAIRLAGRTDAAQIHADLVRYVYATFTLDKFASVFKEDTKDGTGLALYGEGYGAGIQKGGFYRPDKAVILFDAAFFTGPPEEGFWWQPDNIVTEIADKFGIPRVPILGEFSLVEIVEMVRDGRASAISKDARAEGIVARTRSPLFDARGQRLIIKLKTADF